MSVSDALPTQWGGAHEAWSMKLSREASELLAPHWGIGEGAHGSQ